MIENLEISLAMGIIILGDIKRGYVDHIVEDRGHSVTYRVDHWSVTFWWDVPIGKLKARVVGDGEAARTYFSHLGVEVGVPDDIAVMVNQAIHDGTKRQPIWTKEMPGKKGKKVLTAKQADEPDVPDGKLSFGDLPMGWAKKNRKRRT